MNKNKKGGIVETALLATVILAVLKLSGVMEVAWIVVFLPLLAAAVLLAVLLILMRFWNRRDS